MVWSSLKSTDWDQKIHPSQTIIYIMNNPSDYQWKHHLLTKIKDVFCFPWKERKEKTWGSSLTSFSNLLFAEQGPTNRNGADAELQGKKKVVAIQENIILTEKNTKFSCLTVFLCIVEVCAWFLNLHVFPCYETRNVVHALQLECNVNNQKYEQPSTWKVTSYTGRSTSDVSSQRGWSSVTVSSSGLIYSSLQLLFISAAKIKFMASPLSWSLYAAVRHL